MNQLVIKGISKSFRQRQVVDQVSFAIHSKEVVGLLGPNGAGKTTSFYMVVGLLTPDSGTILLNDNDISQLPMYQRARLGLSYLPQEPSIFRRLTVRENLMVALEALSLTSAERSERLESLLEEFSIQHIRDSYGFSLSGGERRRVEIARSLAGQPKFLLLDEPFAGIDPLAIADIRELVAHLKERGLGVLITDHNVRETLDIIDRAYIIHEGEVLIEGKPGDIVGDKDVRRVYLGDRFQM